MEFTDCFCGHDNASSDVQHEVDDKTIAQMYQLVVSLQPSSTSIKRLKKTTHVGYSGTPISKPLDEPGGWMPHFNFICLGWVPLLSSKMISILAFGRRVVALRDRTSRIEIV